MYSYRKKKNDHFNLCSKICHNRYNVCCDSNILKVDINPQAPKMSQPGAEAFLAGCPNAAGQTAALTRGGWAVLGL